MRSRRREKGDSDAGWDAGADRASSLYAQAYQSLRMRILTGQLAPGTVLGEVALSRALGMSRTPIREALAELASRGLVEKIPWRGVIVRKIELQTLVNILEMQACLLEWAARHAEVAPEEDISWLEGSLARQQTYLDEGRMPELMEEARRMDRRIVGLTGNQEMVRGMDTLSDLLIYEASYAAHHHASLQEAVDEHCTIVATLKAGDSDGAAQAVRSHFHAARLRLVG